MFYARRRFSRVDFDCSPTTTCATQGLACSAPPERDKPWSRRSFWGDQRMAARQHWIRLACLVAVATVTIGPAAPSAAADPATGFFGMGSGSKLAVTGTMPTSTPTPTPAPTPGTGNCGMQLGGPAIFCDTFSTSNPGIQSRTGGLDPNVWGVSRIGGLNSPGQGQYNRWLPTALVDCNGTTTVVPPDDVVVCNGQLREALDDQGHVVTLAMYPKQPFDFEGRTGTVSFDVSNDTQGIHSAWPEFWFTDAPVPAPFTHSVPCDFCSVPRHGFGIRMSIDSYAGNHGLCPNGGDVDRWGAAELEIVRDWVPEERSFGHPNVRIFSCVKASPGPNGPLNHLELRISQNQIELWGSDAGSSVLRLMTRWSNVNLSVTRGLVWLEDTHYNATKGNCQSTRKPCQTQHTFTWDNLAFDGPFTYRDFSYDALDALVPHSDGSVDLAKYAAPNQTTSWNVLNMPSNPQAAAARVLFNFIPANWQAAKTLIVTVNGNQHPTAWPYPSSLSQGWWKTLAVTIPVTDLVAGTNVVQIGSVDQPVIVSNVNLVLVNVTGGVPI